MFGQLARQDPDNPRTHAAIAVWHESAGRLADARAAADSALALDAHHEEANLLLAQLDRRAGDLEAARARLDRFDGDGEAGAIAFELGRVLDRLGDGAVAIEAFERGNAALDRDHNYGRYDGKAYAEMVAEIGRGICADQAAPWAETSFDDGLENPIFFIGFPRSGTTLMEQMLDAHQGLISVEEQPMLEAARHCLERNAAADYPALLTGDLSAGLLGQARRAYWDEAIAALGEDAVLVKDPALAKDPAPRQLVDKLPLNIVHLALIRRLFPTAKVLVALRDPRDVVLSCFMQSFAPNDAMAHFGDLGSSADLYVGVMSNWLRQRDYFGANMFAYKYEDLVADPGTLMRDVLAFLGLPWQESVLDYHARQRNRLVATPSYQDVREKIYGRAVARWRIYGDQMAPVQDRLEPFVKAFGY